MNALHERPSPVDVVIEARPDLAVLHVQQTAQRKADEARRLAEGKIGRSSEKLTQYERAVAALSPVRR